MLEDRIEAKWIDAFAEVFALCKVRNDEAVAILSESQSRSLNLQLAELALARLRARPFHVRVPSPRQSAPVPVRSTGASRALQGQGPAIEALAASGLVVDLAVEGMLHAKELPAILARGARLLMISDEHPDALERLVPQPALEAKVQTAIGLAKAAALMRVTSPAGSALSVAMAGARVAGVWGWCDRPGGVAHWPGGLVVAFPKAGSVDGILVLDINLTFKRYLETPVTLRIERDYVIAVEGQGTDAELMRRYFAAWNDPEVYATSHVG
jgi:2,5-dihydroxypyridine 5,6-dioxygenase